VAVEGFEWPVLDAPGYLLELVFGVTRYRRVAMPRLDCGWQWRGVLHEALVSPQAAQARLLPGLRIHVHTDGARSQRPLAEKFAADAEVLRQALIVEPDNARYAFYLAQSLRDANRIVEALAAYRQRIAMGGWDEEVYQSMLQVALLSERSACAEAEILAAYLHAFDYRPSRAEAPCELARYCRLRERYALARTFAGIAATLPPSNDLLFVDASVAAWRARDELAVAATGGRLRAQRESVSRTAGQHDPAAGRTRARRSQSRLLVGTALIERDSGPSDRRRSREPADSRWDSGKTLPGPVARCRRAVLKIMDARAG
jgi:tetratricopeptide (TPR) repeat protein